MQINRFNFIRWYSNVAADNTIKIPRLSNRQPKLYLPVIAIGEAFAFFINADVPFGDDDFGSLTLNLVGDQTYEDVAALSQDVLPDDLGYNIFCNGTLAGIAPGQYQFVIMNGEAVKCISNFIYVTTLNSAQKFTVPVSYRNSRDMYYFRFVDNAAFANKIRLTLNLKDWTPEGNFEQYREVSTGTLRNEKYELDRKITIETYFFDDGAHEAMTILCAMDNITINGVSYIGKGVYKPNVRQTNNVSKGEAELYDQEFSKINKYGIL